MDFAVSPSIVQSLDTETGSDFETIVKMYRTRVFRFMLASLRDSDTAENLTQECFLRAYTAFATFRNECKMSTWLMQIAVNLLRDHAKNRRLQFWQHLRRSAKPPARDALSLVVDGQQSPEAQAVVREQVAGIWKAAEALPEKQRTVFLLRFVQDMDVADIAVAIGSKPATVKTHLLRALISVRQNVGANL